jgi:hypothetical protein
MWLLRNLFFSFFVKSRYLLASPTIGLASLFFSCCKRNGEKSFAPVVDTSAFAYSPSQYISFTGNIF